MATGYIHSGTIAGKLNGVMPDANAERLANGIAIDAARDVLEHSPISSEGMPQANSTISMPRFTSPRDSTSVLPCSRVLHAHEFFKIFFQQHLEFEKDARALDRRRFPSSREMRRRGLDGGIHMLARAHRAFRR